VLPLAGFHTVTPWWHVGYLVCVGGLLFTIATASRKPDRRGVLIAFSWLFGIVPFGGSRLAVYQRFDGAVQ